MTATGERALAAGARFSALEGRYLDVLAALLGRARNEVIATPGEVASPRRELLEAGARRISLAVLRYLVTGDGYRERAWLRDRGRAKGRVWDRALNDGFAPRYTAASRDLWLRGAQVLPTLAAPEASRKTTRALREVVETAGTASGDWVFYAIAHEAIRAFRPPEREREEFTRLLRAGSPLASLLWPDGSFDAGALREHLSRLVAPSDARIVECVEDRLADAWTAYARDTWRSRQGPDALRARWTSLGGVLNAWLSVLDGAQRMDLARPLLTFARALTAGPFAAGSEAVRESLASTTGLKSVKDREALLAAAADVAGVGVRLLRLRDTLASERYGDDRYEEAQVYVRDADRLLAPARRQVEGVARALAGSLG